MTTARWRGALLAEAPAADTVAIEGSIYFPPDSVRFERLVPGTASSRCPWKGEARYYTVLVDGAENPDAAWSYPAPRRRAERIRGFVAFWKGVEIVEE